MLILKPRNISAAHFYSIRHCIPALGDAGTPLHRLNQGAKFIVTLHAVVVATRRMPNREQPRQRRATHDGFAILPHAQIPWVFAGFGCENGKFPFRLRVSK